MKITPQNIRKLSNELRSYLGEIFFAEHVDSFSIDGLSLRDGFIKEQNAHPLSLMWKTFLRDISICEQRGTLSLNSNSIICLHALMCLKNLKDVINLERLIKDLRIKEKFYSTIFEARIASEYRSKGHKIEIQDETGIVKGGICDFFVTIDEQKIYIECKSLSDLLQNERKQWNELIIRVTNMLEQKNLSWNIEIYLGKEIGSKDVKTICSILKKDISLKIIETRYLADNSIIIKKEEIKKGILDKINKTFLINSNAFGEKGQTAFDENKLANLSKNGMQLTDNQFDLASEGLLITEFKMLNGGVPSSLSAFRVSIFPHANFDLTKRIIANLKKGAKQIPKDEMGIVHISVPNTIANHLVPIVDSSYNEIYGRLKRNHGRINAIALYGQFFERNPWGPLLSLHYLIPNLKPNKSLPKNFELLGVENLHIEIPPEKGTVIFEFMMDPMWRPGLTYRIFHHSSPDGNYQLKLLTMPENKLRLEIVTPIIGRQFLLSDEPISLLPTQHYKFAARWGEGEFTMFINGNKIATKEINKSFKRISNRFAI